MELKVNCQCGQNYKFDVEPVNGAMPFVVNCPSCNADGTATANTMLASQAGAPPIAGHSTFTAPPPAPFRSAAPPPMASAPPPAPAMAGLRINKEAAPEPATASVIAPPPLPTRASAPAAAVRQSLIKEPGEYSLGRGILGAVIGSAVGCGLMYGFFLWAQFRFPLTGCAVGAAVGYTARLMARGTDSTLGFIAAAIAVLSVAGTLVAMYGEFPMLAIISVAVSGSFAYRISSG